MGLLELHIGVSWGTTRASVDALHGLSSLAQSRYFVSGRERLEELLVGLRQAVIEFISRGEESVTA